MTTIYLSYAPLAVHILWYNEWSVLPRRRFRCGVFRVKCWVHYSSSTRHDTLRLRISAHQNKSQINSSRCNLPTQEKNRVKQYFLENLYEKSLIFRGSQAYPNTSRTLAPKVALSTLVKTSIAAIAGDAYVPSAEATEMALGGRTLRPRPVRPSCKACPSLEIREVASLCGFA